eukprot:ANDGO_06985.mRNA.1 putative nucleolar protein 5-1
MLVLFETPAGYALFKVLDEKKLANVDALSSSFSTPETASKIVRLKAFSRFADTTEALSAATALVEATVDKPLRKFLKKHLLDGSGSETLAVCDPRLGGAIKEALGISCVADNSALELMRGIRSQLTALLGFTSSSIGANDSENEASESVIKAMALGLAHSFSRYKLKFSPDKIDTMVVQAVGLLDDLDKELNKYAMRVREWYSWHFPELSKIVADHVRYARVILAIGVRSDAAATSLEEILEDELSAQVKEAAKVSMGAEIAPEDLVSISELAKEVLALHEYRAQLYDYLRARMQAIAPNLTCMVGEVVGARLIAHAGSLINLAKHPASTVQILGAEKALFRALKAKKDTPKYGLIFHASVVGQAAPKNKGKISRVLAAKTALSVRVDALGEKDHATIGVEDRARVEQRLGLLEGRQVASISGRGRTEERNKKYDTPSAPAKSYNEAADVVMKPAAAAAARVDESDEERAVKKDKKDKKAEKKEKTDKEEKKDKKKDKKVEKKDEDDDQDDAEDKKRREKKEKKSKKREREESDDDSDEDKKDKKKSKKSKKE